MQIDRRHYRFKKVATTFFCPLCATERVMRLTPRLNIVNHLQVALLTGTLTWIFFSWLGFKTVFSYFVFWAVFEFAIRAVYRKDIPCPHCGFDASWYKRDVKVARRLVKDFWSAQESQTSETQASSLKN
jgi:predicted RNA-binding Zn-ribbon protein involved in translation (DUF1610 family)